MGTSSALSLPRLAAVRNRKAALAKANCKPESQATQLLIDLDSYRKQRLGGGLDRSLFLDGFLTHMRRKPGTGDMMFSLLNRNWDHL